MGQEFREDCTSCRHPGTTCRHPSSTKQPSASWHHSNTTFVHCSSSCTFPNTSCRQSMNNCRHCSNSYRPPSNTDRPSSSSCRLDSIYKRLYCNRSRHNKSKSSTMPHCVALLLMIVAGAMCDEGVVVMENIVAPQPARAGDDITLLCLWSVEYSSDSSHLRKPRGSKGFSQVKWWKDGHQLFKIDSNGEKTDYRLPGVDVVTKDSNATMVKLRSVTRSSEGKYVCEVMGEGPTFRTTNATVNLTVAEVPQSAQLSGVRKKYWTGEMLNATCTVRHARPPATISFKLMDKLILPQSEHVRLYPPLEEQGGTYTTYATLTLPLAEEHVPAARVACLARVKTFHLHEAKVAARVDRATHSLLSIFGSGVERYSPTHLVPFVLLLGTWAKHLVCPHHTTPLVLT